MPRMRKYHPVTEDGFTEWVAPRMSGFTMKCCDCGLKHEFQFRIGRVTRMKKNGESWVAEVGPEFITEMRVRRAIGRNSGKAPVPKKEVAPVQQAKASQRRADTR